MEFDICVDVYNSTDEIDRWINTLINTDYNKKNIGLYFYASEASAPAIQHLASVKAALEENFKDFEVLFESSKNSTAAKNKAAGLGSSNYILFCSIKHLVTPCALSEIKQAALASEGSYAAFELRQIPFEHMQYYNPVTLEIPVTKTDSLAIKRTVFSEIGGFDASMPKAGIDVDFSWNLRAHGFKIKYVPCAVLSLNCSETESPNSRSLPFSEQLAANLAIRYKYGKRCDIKEWKENYTSSKITHNAAFEDKSAQSAVLNTKKNKHEYRRYYNKVIKNNLHGFSPVFCGEGYEFLRAGGSFASIAPKNEPFFSVLVRTYKRPNLLRQTLLSLCNQTYKNFEVVVVEDGEEPVSQSVAAEMQGMLNIQYHAMGRQSGRCAAGNKALELAGGDFLCFLDDDDYFFADHLETIASQISLFPEGKFFAALSIMAESDSDDAAADIFNPKAMVTFGKSNPSPLDIFQDNLFPIQAVVFHNSLPKEHGGFDEEMSTGHEDWEMWLRYTKHNKIYIADKATSIFRIPENPQINYQRTISLYSTMPDIAAKMKDYNIALNGRELFEMRYSQEIISGRVQAMEEKEKLSQTAREISASATWRKTAFLRAIPNALATWGKALSKGLLRFSNFIGPKEIDFENAELDELHEYIVTCKNSFLWRTVRKLSNKNQTKD